MTRLTTLRIAAAFALVFCATAQAQLFRAYVSSTGSDANPCTVQQPCRLLPAALAAVKDGGEVWMLDSANYNTATVTVTKSVSILAIPGALGSVVGNGGDAIAIDTAGVSVTLRNLKILNLSDGRYGIYMTNGAALKVLGCEIAGFALSNSAGIRVATPAKVTVADSVVRDNYYGILLNNGARGDVARTTVVGSGSVGIFASPLGNSTVTVTVTDTVASNNGYGFYAYSDSASWIARMTVSRSAASNNGTHGFGANGPAAFMTVSGSVASGNGTGFFQGSAATFRSLVDNTVFDNNADTSGVITTAAPK
jgi:hypothetical protein